MASRFKHLGVSLGKPSRINRSLDIDNENIDPLTDDHMLSHGIDKMNISPDYSQKPSSHHNNDLPSSSSSPQPSGGLSIMQLTPAQQAPSLDDDPAMKILQNRTTKRSGERRYKVQPDAMRRMGKDMLSTQDDVISLSSSQVTGIEQQQQQQQHQQQQQQQHDQVREYMQPSVSSSSSLPDSNVNIRSSSRPSSHSSRTSSGLKPSHDSQSHQQQQSSYSNHNDYMGDSQFSTPVSPQIPSSRSQATPTNSPSILSSEPYQAQIPSSSSSSSRSSGSSHAAHTPSLSQHQQSRPQHNSQQQPSSSSLSNHRPSQQQQPQQQQAGLSLSQHVPQQRSHPQPPQQQQPRHPDSSSHQNHVSSTSTQVSQFPTLNINGQTYYILKQLGKGGSGRVLSALNESTREICAIKEIDLSSDLNMVSGIESEISLLVKLKGHRHVVQLLDYQKSIVNNAFYIVLELGNADLSQILHKIQLEYKQTLSSQQLKNMKNEQLYPEYGIGYSGVNIHDLRHYWTQMLHCVKVCHDNSIIHLDLKPANFLSVNGTLKIIDFGIATMKQHDHTSVIRDSCLGTVSFMSPEQFTDSCPTVRPSSDIWAMGCILHFLVFGYTPYAQLSKSPYKRIAAIGSDTPYTIPPIPIQLTNGDSRLDKQVYQLLSLCLQKDPKQRPTIEQLLQHPFLSPSGGIIDDAPLQQQAQQQQQQPPLNITPSQLSQALTLLLHKQKKLRSQLKDRHANNNNINIDDNMLILPRELCSDISIHGAHLPELLSQCINATLQQEYQQQQQR